MQEQERSWSKGTWKVMKRFHVREDLGQRVYMALSAHPKIAEENRETLRKIAAMEERHVAALDRRFGTRRVGELRVLLVLLLVKVFGFTFTLKQLERIQGRVLTPSAKQEAGARAPDLLLVFQEEDVVDQELLTLLDEERLYYISSMVLGLNDALVELSGAIAGFTFALRDNNLIALSGIITGISASLSMASSEFLSTRADGRSRKTPLKAALITGLAYVVTVSLMVFPYLLFPNHRYVPALFVMLCIVITIIFIFSYFISVAKGENFKRNFGEMAAVSLSVAFVSFLIGILVRNALGIEI